MPQLLSNSTSLWTPVRVWVGSHKIWASIIVVLILGGGWLVYSRATSTAGVTRYVLGNVANTTIVASVSGSGQVSPSDQLDIKPKQSGEITDILVQQGDSVKEGQAIAYIDATDAEKAVRDAKANLQSAQLSLAKLQEPPTTLTVTQAQNALTDANDALTKLYSDSQTDVTNSFLDLPDIITSLQGVMTGTDSNSNQQWNADFYENAIAPYDLRAKDYHDTALGDYQNAKSSYDAAFSDFHAMGNSPDQATIEKVLNETYDTVSLAAKAANSINAFVQLYEDTLNNHNLKPAAVADTALTDLNTDTGKLNTHISTLLSDINTLKTDKESIIEKQQSLDQTNAGADTIDIQSSQLNVTKAQNSLTDAENTLADYTVRAPFTGTIAKVDVNKGDQADTGSALATIITSTQIADLSLNEVDAEKVKVGQKATLTFDAIDGLSIAGTVASVDTLGTVSQGVVSYDVKIDFSSQDARVKPGMTANASIITDTAQDTLAIPSGAVKTVNGQSVVQVFQPPLQDTTGAAGTTGIPTAQTPVNVPVTTGISDDTNIQILSGLTEGEQYIVRTMTGASAASAAGRTTTTGAAAGGGFRGGGGGGLGGIRLGG